jgi:hypothetical protein
MPFIATEAPVVHPRFMILGDPGSGKTYLLGLFHELYKKYGNTKGLYLYDFDSGYPTLRSAGFDVTVELCVDVNSDDPKAWALFANDTEKFEKDSQGYGIVAADSFTTLQNALFNDICKFNVLKDRRSFHKVKLTTQNDFGVFARTVTNQFFPQYIRLCEKMAVALTVHTELLKEEGQPPRILPRVMGQALSGSVLGLYFNEVILCKVTGTGSNATRMIQTGKDFQVDLKSQAKAMPFELTPIEYVFRIGVAYGILKGDMIGKYAVDHKLDLSKVKDYK